MVSLTRSSGPPDPECSVAEVAGQDSSHGLTYPLSSVVPASRREHRQDSDLGTWHQRLRRYVPSLRLIDPIWRLTAGARLSLPLFWPGLVPFQANSRCTPTSSCRRAIQSARLIFPLTAALPEFMCTSGSRLTPPPAQTD